MKKILMRKIFAILFFALFPLLSSQAATFTDTYENLNYVDQANTNAFYDAPGQRFTLPIIDPHPMYSENATLQSKNILSSSQQISSILLTVDQIIPTDGFQDEGEINYFVSFNGGTDWMPITPGNIVNLGSPIDTSNLIYKADFRAIILAEFVYHTPILNSVTIEYLPASPAPFCGDGIINQASEQCDDGNNQDGDGCSANCQIEVIPSPQTFTVSGVVFNDQNQNALYNTEESLYENVTVNLIDEHKTVIATATTDTHGFYKFTVPKGTYTIKITDSHGVLTNLIATTPQEIKISLNSNLTNQNFGYYASVPKPEPEPKPETKPEPKPETKNPQPEKPETNTTKDICSGFIGDTIWLDENGNGKEDKKEKGIDNIHLKLKWAGKDNKWNTSDDKELKTKTNRKGYYKFKNLEKGRYKVKVDKDDIEKRKLIQTYDPSGITMDLTSTITLKCNEKHDKADFGFKKKAVAQILFATGKNNLLPQFIFWLALSLSIILAIWSWKIRRETRIMKK